MVWDIIAIAITEAVKVFERERSRPLMSKTLALMLDGEAYRDTMDETPDWETCGVRLAHRAYFKSYAVAFKFSRRIKRIRHDMIQYKDFYIVRWSST